MLTSHISPVHPGSQIHLKKAKVVKWKNTSGNSQMYLFQEVGKPELGFPNHKFIQLWARTSARRARVLPITVWTSGWENQFWFPKFLEEAFSDITVISQWISPLWKCTKFHHHEIYFPHWENESPGGELWLIDDYHQEIYFPNKESKSTSAILWLKITDILSMCGLLL